MADNKLENSLRKLEVLSKTIEVVRNVYFYEKERKDKLIENCLTIIENEVDQVKNNS
jgi:hypothetical protein